MQVGNSAEVAGRNRAESHFGLWAVLKAPLLIGADLRLIDLESLAVLRNQAVISVNQDALGVAGDLLWQQGSLQVCTCIRVYL